MAFERLRFPKDYERRPGSPSCVLDALAALDASLLPIDGLGRDTFPTGSQASFAGWAILPVLGGYQLPAAVLLKIGETGAYFGATTGIGREDVARNLADVRLSGAGFRGTQAIGEDLPHGVHELSLAIVGDDRSYFEIALRRRMEIVASSRLFPKLPKSDRTAVGPTSLEAMHGRERSGSARVKRFECGSILIARGDAAERDSLAPASRVFAIVDEERYYGGIVGLANESGERNAFSIRIPTQHLTAGNHALRIAAIANDGTSYTLGEKTVFSLSRT